MQIFYYISCISRFLLIVFLIQISGSRGKAASFSACLLQQLFCLAQICRISGQIFLLLLLFLFLTSSNFLLIILIKDGLKNFVLVLSFLKLYKWGCPDLNRGHQLSRTFTRLYELIFSRENPRPRLGSYQTRLHPLSINL